MSKGIWIILASAIIILPQGVLYSSPYALSPATESIVISSGAALYGISLYTENKTDPLTDKEIAALSDSNLNKLDRSAADNWSTSADNWSDRILIPFMMSPAAFLIEEETRSDIITIGVMYAESVLITQGLNLTTKNMIKRNRPFTCNPEAPMQEKKERDAVLSFYSGHTVNAFNSAVFTSTVFSDYYPESSWRYAVWGASLSTAAFTGYLRYRAGMHYPTDIIAGAVIGSITGRVIPALHRNNNRDISIHIIPGEENILAVILYF